MTKVCLYFAFGSNLLSKRIHINVPSAKRKDIGFLKDYRLDFGYFSKRWNGASATIVPQEDSHVWGAVWEIDENDKPKLDAQEGVHNGIYFPLEINVQTPSGQILQCLAYQLRKLPPNCGSLESLPDERKPSLTYLDTIIRGAEESNLPEEYISFLKKVPHNGFSGEVDLQH